MTFPALPGKKTRRLPTRFTSDEYMTIYRYAAAGGYPSVSPYVRDTLLHPNQPEIKEKLEEIKRHLTDQDQKIEKIYVLLHTLIDPTQNGARPHIPNRSQQRPSNDGGNSSSDDT